MGSNVLVIPIWVAICQVIAAILNAMAVGRASETDWGVLHVICAVALCINIVVLAMFFYGQSRLRGKE